MPIRAPKSWEYAVHIGKSDVALMLMTYVGTLKSLVYKPLLRWFGTGVRSIREPMLIASAISIWLFYLLLRRMAGERAAVVGCILLAGDTLYLLTSVFDWGPVALQHLLTVGGMLLLLRFYQQRGTGALAGGCFLFGLAMWDKALAAWMISGMGIAAAMLFWREIAKVVTVRRVAIAVLAFVVGALPLLVYNGANHWSTFASNVKRDGGDVQGKARLLMETLRGIALVGTLTEEKRVPPEPHRPSGVVQEASASLAEQTGHPLRNYMLYAVVLSVLLTPLAWGRGLRCILFAWIAMAIAWVQMAFTAGAGGSVHHTILLWPLPYIPIAISFAAASERFGKAGLAALAGVTALLTVSCVLVTNEYYSRMVRQGGSVPWTDAIFTLNDTLKGTTAPYVFCVDWGVLDNLRLMGNGKLPVRDGAEHIGGPELTAQDREAVRQMVSIPGALFVTHPKEIEFQKGNTERLVNAAAQAGFQAQHVMMLGDSFGRPTYEIFRFDQSDLNQSKPSLRPARNQ